MLGFYPISSLPISGTPLPAITGSIYVTDSNDSATFTDQELVSGVISTTDSADTCDFEGGVTLDTHDGFTKREIERAKTLDRKHRAAEEKLIEARRADAETRKKRFRDLIDPVAPKQQTKKNKVQLKQEIRIDTPSVEVTRLEAVIANLDRQEKELNQAIAHRKVLAETMTALAILDAKFKAEMDDEEALLMLL